MVRETGLEPVWCIPHAPQTCASASSATLACRPYSGNVDIIPQKFFLVNPYFYFFAIFMRYGAAHTYVGRVCQFESLAL